MYFLSVSLSRSYLGQILAILLSLALTEFVFLFMALLTSRFSRGKTDMLVSAGNW